MVKNKDITRLLLAMSIAAGILLRVYWWFFNIQGSDYYFLKAGLVTTPLSDLIWKGCPFDQSAPVGYLIVAKGLGVLSNYNDWVMRFPCLFAGILSLLLFVKLLKKNAMNNVLVIASILFAFNTSLVYYSVVLKQYAIDVLCVLITFVLMSSQIKNSVRTLCVACLVPFSHAMFFCGGAYGIYAIIQLIRNFHNSQDAHFSVFKRDICPVIFLFLVACVCAFLTVKTMPEYMMQGFWDSAFAPLPMSLTSLKWYLVRIPGLFRGPVFFLTYPNMSGIGCALLFLPLLLTCYGVWHSSFKPLFWVASGTFVLCLLASLLKHWAFGSGDVLQCRTILFLAPILLLFLCNGLSCIIKKRGRVAILCLPVALSMVLSCFYMHPRTWQTESALDRLSLEAQAGDALVCDYHVYTALLSDTKRHILERFRDKVFIQKTLNEDVGEVELPPLGRDARVFVCYGDTPTFDSKGWYGAHRPSYRRFVEKLEREYLQYYEPHILVKGTLK